MVKLFYGEDNYSLNKAVKALEKEFQSAYFGDININKLSAANLTYDEFIRSVASVPFLSDTRLLIIYNLIKEGDEKLKEQICQQLGKIPKSTELVLVEEGEVAKNLRIFKAISKYGSVSHFPLLRGYDLERWLANYAKKSGLLISLPAIKQLIATVGNNTWKLTNELEKLDLYRIAQGKKQIEESDIYEMVQTENDPSIFDFIDSLGARNAKLASKYLNQLFESGKNENYILTMIVYQFRNLLLIEDLIVHGVDKKNISEEADIHPFVVKKAFQVLKNFDLAELKRIYSRLMRADLDIKSGATDGRLALEKLLVDLTL